MSGVWRLMLATASGTTALLYDSYCSVWASIVAASSPLKLDYDFKIAS
jgi:hypothetical protein